MKIRPFQKCCERLLKFSGLDKDEAESLYDYAGKAQNTIPYDLPEYIMDRDDVAAALRTAKDLNAGKEQWEKFVEATDTSIRKANIPGSAKAGEWTA